MQASDNPSSEQQLAARHEAEAQFHDVKYTGEELYPAHYGVKPTYPVFVRMKEMLGDVRGKRILDCGCGEGWTTEELAAMGATLDAFDISGEAVAHTQERLRAKGFEGSCTVRKMSGERLDYPDGSFDVVIGFAILHHLELSRTMPELLRVLKPGGIALFGEPLGTNPLINFYRKLTPKYRTVDEKPMSFRDIEAHLSGFKAFRHQEMYVIALLSLGLAYVPGLRRAFSPVSRALRRVDDWVLRLIPSLGKWAWYSILTFEK